MPRKSDQNFVALPLTPRRLPCDFTAVNQLQPQSVTIRRLHRCRRSRCPGICLFPPRDFSRSTPAKGPITLYQIEIMRGFVSRFKTRGQDCRARHGVQNTRLILIARPLPSSPARRNIRSSADFARDFFLFYLTGKTIFDNRHGLLKKFDSGRRTETLSAANPQN
jgi:hypothetical protein